MNKRIFQILFFIFIASVVFFLCTSPNNPFDNSHNSKIYLAIKDSKNQIGQSPAISDTIGNTDSVGVCPYLYNFVDSVTITIVNSSNDTDTSFVVRRFISDADTQWYGVTFRAKGTETIKVVAFIQPATKYPLTGVITILPAKITLAPMPQAMSVPADSSTFISISVINGRAPYRFQWFHSTTAVSSIITSALTSDTLFVRNAALSDSGFYSCVVLDTWGDSAVSTTTALTVTPISIVKVNNKPNLHVSGRINILNTQICTLTVSADDPDSGQTVTISLIKGPQGNTFVNNLFVWQPAPGYLGTDTATFVARDNGTPPMSDTAIIPIQVTATILPPDSAKGIVAVSRINGSFVFKWNKSQNADQYAVYRSRDTTAAGFVLFATTPDTVFTATKDTAFFYYVVATNSKGSSAPSLRIHSTVINTPPTWSHPTISISVYEGSSISFSCTDSCKDSNGDAVSFSLESGGPATDSLIGSIWKYTPSNTDSGTYQVKIKAWDGMDSSIVTMAVHVVVVTVAPNAPTLVVPADGAINQPVSPVLIWNKIANAAAYYVQVASDTGFGSIVTSDSVLTDTTKSVVGTINGATYYWRVRAKNAVGVSPWSARRSFATIIAAPSIPVLTAPGDNAINVSVAPTLTWNTVAGASTYRVQVSTSNTFASLYTQDSLLTTGSKAISGLSNNTKYYWRVNATNAGGTSAWATDSFTTIVGGPAVPTLTAPLDNAMNVAVNPSLNWNSVAGASTYRVQVSTTNSFASTLVDSTLAATSKTANGLSNSTKYYWRVTAINVGGASAWAMDSFTTIVAIPTITIQPQSKSANKGGSVTLSVTAMPSGVTYAWHQKNNATIKSTAQTCPLTNLAYSDSGQYYVIISNAAGSVTSDTTAKVTVVDNVPPTITLIGQASYSKMLGAPFNDPGATATDDRDGDLTSSIQVTNPININVPGNYTITYHVADKTGNQTSVTRAVKYQGWVTLPDINGTSFSTTMASDGTLYMAYVDGSGNLQAMKFSSTSGWQQLGSQNLDASAANVIMATDKSRAPYISYSSNNQMRIQKYSSTWQQLKGGTCSDPRSLTYAYSFNLSNDAVPVPYMIWEGSWYIIPAYLNGNGCWMDTLGGSFDGGGFRSSLAFTSTNTPWVAYEGGPNVRVKYYDASLGWQSVTDSLPWTSVLAPSGSQYSLRVVLKIDANNVPYVLRTSADGYPEVWKESGTSFQSTGTLYAGPISDVDFTKSTDNQFYGVYMTNNGSYDTAIVKKDSTTGWNRFPAITNGVIPIQSINNSNGYYKNISIEAASNAFYVIYNKGSGLIGTLEYIPQ